MAPLPSSLRTLIDQVQAAAAARAPLQIRGSGSKDFYGGHCHGGLMDMRPHAGITQYDPTELVITARAGTPMADLNDALARRGQYLPFDPPCFGPQSTVGGMVAAGLAGPARASVGSVRDYVLGATLLNGKGELLTFGGQVMKNVAGYDVPRLLAGSMGVLGALCEVSLKVLPVPVASTTLRVEMTQIQALRVFNQWSSQPLPLHAGVWWDDTLAVWLRGAAAAVEATAQRLVQEVRADVVDPDFATSFWRGLRDHRDEFFQQAYAASLKWCEDRPEECGAMVAKRVDMLTPEGVADSVRADNTAFVTAREAKPELEFFFGRLHARQPALIGGKLPPDDFYYGGK